MSSPSTSPHGRPSAVTSANQPTQKVNSKVAGAVRKVHTYRPGTVALREIKYKRRRADRDDEDEKEEESQPPSSRQRTGKATDCKTKKKKVLSETAELKRELAQRLFDEAFECAPMWPGGGTYLVKCLTEEASDADKNNALNICAILDRNVVYRVRFYEEHINRSEAFKAEKVELDDMPDDFQEYVTEAILDKQSFQAGWHKWVGDDEEWQSYDVDDFTDGVGAFECMEHWKLN